MKFGETDFGYAFTGSGARNFFGEGWWYHNIFKLLFPGMFDFTGSTFISKTTPLLAKAGNMLLKKNLQPEEWFPKCIVVDFPNARALNAVGLSSPGAYYLFNMGAWQERTKPFEISFMPIGKTKENRLDENRVYTKLFQKKLPGFQAKVASQFNLSCPNAGHCTTGFFKETMDHLEIHSKLGIPIDMKFNALVTIDLLMEIDRSKLCDCVTISNTIPAGALKEMFDWEKIFRGKKSPLHNLGGGGLSGKPLTQPVSALIAMARDRGFSGNIKGGGGIMCREDVKTMARAGVNAIEFTTATMVRPFNVASIIDEANKQFGGDQ